jgi:hypothetical protein
LDKEVKASGFLVENLKSKDDLEAFDKIVRIVNINDIIQHEEFLQDGNQGVNENEED